ncbi:MAG TPA: hypothetical protein VK194_03175 [Candidatus Deferrimicrobium sp.]|nr:hypothetical protein [Candidatus Deferrimicrobium sp.]
MTFGQLLAIVIGLLDRSGIPFMVTGSLASSYHGEPRATRDADIVIDPSTDAIERLVDGLLAAGFYVDRDVARGAVRARSQFNAIGPDSTKVDFLIRRDRPFSVEEFARRRPADLLGTPGFVATAEDVILSKLEWAQASGSDRQLDDVAGILAIATGLDLDYIDRWARVLGVERAWSAVRDDRT